MYEYLKGIITKITAKYIVLGGEWYRLYLACSQSLCLLRSG